MFVDIFSGAYAQTLRVFNVFLLHDILILIIILFFQFFFSSNQITTKTFSNSAIISTFISISSFDNPEW